MNAHGSDDADGNAGQEAASQSYSRRHPGEPPSTPNQLSAMSASVPMPSRQGNFMGDGWLALHQPRSNAPQQTFKTPAHPSGMKNRTMGSSDRGGLASARKNLLAKTPFHKDMAPTFHRTPGAPVSDRNFGNTSASVPGRSHWGFGIPSGGNDDRQKAANRFGLRAFQEPRNAYEDGGSRLMKPAGGNPLGYGFGDGQRQSGGPGVSRSFNGQSPRGDSSWTKPDFSMSTPIGNRRSDLPFDKGNVLATPSMQSTYPKNSDNSQSFPPRANPMRTTEHVGNAFGFGFSRTINEFNSTSSSGFAAEPSAYSPGYHATGPPLPSSGKGDVPLLAQLKNKFETNGLVDVPIGPSSNNPLAMPPSSSAFNAQSGMNPEAPVFTFPATEQQMPPSPGRGFFDKRLHESERQRNNVGKGSARLPRDAGRGTVGRDMGFDPHHSHPPRQQRQRKATQRSREWQDVNSHALGNNGKRGGPRDRNQKKPQKGKGREDRKKNGRVKHEGGKKNGGKDSLNGGSGALYKSHKEFYPVFKEKEKKEGAPFAREYARACVTNGEYDPKSVWRIYRSWADLEKRENQFEEARKLYKTVNSIDPDAKEGWLEYAKMEEECGNLIRCREILYEGLDRQGKRPEKKMIPTQNENLLKHVLKINEKIGDLDRARKLLSDLSNYSINDTWRTVLEGALMEARTGNVAKARQVFEKLMKQVPWSGQVYLEASRLEEKMHCYERSLEIVVAGLTEVPRFGHLWFAGFRLNENIEVEKKLKGFEQECSALASSSKDGYLPPEWRPRLRLELNTSNELFDKSVNEIARELVWKVNFEKAQMYERAAKLIGTTVAYAKSLYDPAQYGESYLGPVDEIDNAAISEWVAKARNTYRGNIEQCPENLRWKIWLAAARTELAAGKPDVSRTLLNRALSSVPSKNESYVLLESARVEEYLGKLDVARDLLLKGRTQSVKEWKVFLESVLLESRAGNRDMAIHRAEEALLLHPGTGRLWAVLIQLKSVVGPATQFNILHKALKEVPKSGEVWCEAARLALNPTSPFFNLVAATKYLQFAVQFTPQYGDSFLEFVRLEILKQVEQGVRRSLAGGAYADNAADLPSDAVDNVVSGALASLDLNSIDYTALLQSCVNADPNYGVIWFHCKKRSFDTARRVFQTAKERLTKELSTPTLLGLYAKAIVASWKKRNSNVLFSQISLQGKGKILACENIEEKINEIDHSNGGAARAIGVPDGMIEDDFTTGLIEVNKILSPDVKNDLSDSRRLKTLFGSDQILVT